VAKDKKEKGVDPRTLSEADLLALINSRAKRPALRAASASRGLDIRRLETGVIGFDVASGGGIPEQRITMLFGPPKGGKSTMSLKIAAEAQGKCRCCGLPWRRVFAREALKAAATTWEPKYPIRSTLWSMTNPKAGVLPTHGFEEDYGTNVDDAGWEAWLKAHTDFSEERRKELKKVTGADDRRDEMLDALVAERAKDFPFPPKTARACQCDTPTPGKILWVDVEVSFDPEWATRHGINLDWVFVIRPGNGEEAVDTADVMLRSGAIALLVVDSLAQMSPDEELAKSAMDTLMAAGARMVNRAMRKWVSALAVPGASDRATVTILVINQIRLKTGVTFGNPETLPHGLGQLFAVSLSARMSMPEVDKARAEQGLPARWVSLKAVISNNRTYPQGATGEYQLFLLDCDGRSVGETDEIDAVMRRAKTLGVVWTDDDAKAKEKWKFEARDHTKVAASSEPALLSKLRENDDLLFADVRRQVLDKTLGRLR
jgi:RecA/RadA recombinase